jgi:hypothetical protein
MAICGTTPETSTLRKKHLAVAGERVVALLDARPAGVVEADTGQPTFSA